MAAPTPPAAPTAPSPQDGLQASERNHQPSPLLRLPPELCNKIYAYALGGHSFKFTSPSSFKPGHGHDITTITGETSLVPNRAGPLPPPKPHNVFALLSTNRQIHAETRLLPMSLNAFGILYSWPDLAAFTQTPQAEHVATLAFYLSGTVGGVIRGVQHPSSISECPTDLRGFDFAGKLPALRRFVLGFHGMDLTALEEHRSSGAAHEVAPFVALAEKVAGEIVGVGAKERGVEVKFDLTVTTYDEETMVFEKAWGASRTLEV